MSKSLPERGILCARVALDVPVPKLFDYLVPHDFPAQVGARVTVPFGARQRCGVIVELDAPSAMPAQRLKRLVAVRDDMPPLPADWLELMRFLSGYYQRPFGETVMSALPPRLRSVKPLPRGSAKIFETPAMRFAPAHALTGQQTAVRDRLASALGRF